MQEYVQKISLEYKYFTICIKKCLLFKSKWTQIQDSNGEHKKKIKIIDEHKVILLYIERDHTFMIHKQVHFQINMNIYHWISEFVLLLLFI